MKSSSQNIVVSNDLKFFREGRKIIDRSTIADYDNLYRPFFGVTLDKKIYSTFCFYNVVCVLDVDTGDIELKKFSLNEPYYGDAMHFAVEMRKDSLVLLPHRSPNLIIANLLNNSCKFFSYGDRGNVNYNRSIFYDKYLYMFPVFRPDIGIFDFENECVNFFQIPIEDGSHNFNKDDMFAIVSTCVVRNKAFMLGTNPNCVMEFDCKSETLVWHDELADCMSMCFDGKYYWIGKKDKTVIKTDFVNVKEFRKETFPIEFDATDILPLSGAFFVNGYVIFTSYRAGTILRIDAETEKIDCLNLPKTNGNFDSCTILGMDGERLYLFSRQKTAVIVSDVSSNTYKTVPMKFTDESLYMLKEQEKNIFGKNYDLSFLLNRLQTFQSENSREYKRNGKKIYEYFKGV